MILWKVETIRFGAYVLADTPDRAIKAFEDWLESNAYGYSKARRVIKVEKIAEQTNHPKQEAEDLEMLLFDKPLPKVDVMRMME